MPAPTRKRQSSGSTTGVPCTVDKGAQCEVPPNQLLWRQPRGHDTVTVASLVQTSSGLALAYVEKQVRDDSADELGESPSYFCGN